MRKGKWNGRRRLANECGSKFDALGALPFTRGKKRRVQHDISELEH